MTGAAETSSTREATPEGTGSVVVFFQCGDKSGNIDGAVHYEGDGSRVDSTVKLSGSRHFGMALVR